MMSKVHKTRREQERNGKANYIRSNTAIQFE